MSYRRTIIRSLVLELVEVGLDPFLQQKARILWLIGSQDPSVTIIMENQ